MHARIDTHHHIVPPAYADWLQRRGVTAGGLPIPKWSVEGALDLMDAAGIQAGIFSVSTPGVHLGDDAEARRMARQVNEFAAGVVARHPQRFGFFATLTLPDVFQDQDKPELMYAAAGLDADAIANAALLALGRGVNEARA